MATGPQPARARVLVAEDDPAIALIVTKLLEGDHYDVTVAEDGAAALKQLASGGFDFAVLDVHMPQLTGLEVLAELRQRGRAIRAIIMTADNTQETVLGALRQQVCRYIRKPFEPVELLDAVKQLLETPPEPLPIEVVSSEPHWVELLVPCHRNSVERVQDLLMNLLSGIAAGTRDDIAQAFRELLMNAIEWGGRLNPEHRVRISCIRTERILIYRIADYGPGFRFEALDHAAVSHPGDPTHHVKVRDAKGMRAGGFGLLITRSLVDELVYNEQHNEVMFVKYLSP